MDGCEHNRFAQASLALRQKCDSPRMVCAQRATHKYMWSGQEIIVISIVTCCHSVNFAHLPLELFDRNIRNRLPCLSQAQHIEMTRGEYVLGFKSCDIPIDWWIWTLPFFLNYIWIRIGEILLNLAEKYHITE